MGESRRAFRPADLRDHEFRRLIPHQPGYSPDLREVPPRLGSDDTPIK